MRANLRMPLDALTQAQAHRRMTLSLQFPHAKPVPDGVPIGWIIVGIVWTLVGLVWSLPK